MNNDNPYRAPAAAVADVPPEGVLELAGRGHRFGASVIDGIAAMLLILPFGFATGFYSFERADRHQFLTTLVMVAVSFVVFVLIQSYFLLRNGQTIGKKIVGIRIVDLEGNVPGLLTLLGRRYAPIYIVQAIPMAGNLLPLIDILFIFREDRRCIHDLIARTKVVLSGAKYSSTTWAVAPFLLMIVLGIGAAVIIPAFTDNHRATRATPAKPAVPAPQQQPAQNGKANAPAPAATDMQPTSPAANAAPVANATGGAPTQSVSDADLRKCLELKDPAAIARCSGTGK